MTQYQDLIERNSPTVVIGYTNWRGEYGEREIVPMRPWFGSTDWHPEAQWLLKAWDVEKDAERDFAIKDIGFVRSGGEEKDGVHHIADAGQMVLVPMIPTDEMLQAFEDEYVCMFGAALGSPWSKAEKLYGAMLSAAPNPANTEPSLRAENERLREAAFQPSETVEAIIARAAATQAKLDEAAKVLEPFADAVFNDNGDITVNFGAPDPDDFFRAYSFLSKLKGAE